MRVRSLTKSSSSWPVRRWPAVGLAFFIAATPPWLYAQDSRTVTEPSFPPPCTVLTANQVAGSLDETAFDTPRIQEALNSCPAGQAVELATDGDNNAFLIQPITLPSGVTLIVDAEVTVFTSRNRADYPCPGPSSSDCTPIITVAPGGGSGLMGYGVIDGRGGQNLLGETVSWWTQIPLDPRPRMVQLVTANDFTLYKVTLLNGPKFHVFGTGNGLIAWDVKITAPNNSPNTDGIDPSGSHDITITNSFISVGDDHIAIKAGVSHVSNITISHNRFYQGHGVSIGSETNAGAENVLVTDFVMDGAGASSQNVIRIKSDSTRGGEVKNVTYENICARNPGHPFVFNPFYTTSTGSLYPNFHDIVVHNMHVLNRMNSSTLKGYWNSSGVDFPLGITLNNVEIAFSASDFPSTQVNHVNFILGPDPVRPVDPGVVSVINDLAANPANYVTVTNNVSNDNPSYACDEASFVYLAGELFAPANNVTVEPDGSQTVTLSAIVQPIVSGAAAPSGTISMLEGEDVVASSPVAGRITPIPIPHVGPGPHTYTAQYSGDSNYTLLNFGSVTIVDSTTTLSSSASRVSYGDPVTFTAGVRSDSGIPIGALTFLDGSSPLNTATLDPSGQAIFTTSSLSAGRHLVRAQYAGGSGFEASVSAPVGIWVTRAIPVVTVRCPSPVPFDHHPHACTAEVRGIGGASVSGTTTLTYNGSPRPPSAVGTYRVIARFVSTDSNYTNAEGMGRLTIRRDDDEGHGDHGGHGHDTP